MTSKQAWNQNNDEDIDFFENRQSARGLLASEQKGATQENQVTDDSNVHLEEDVSKLIKHDTVQSFGVRARQQRHRPVVRVDQSGHTTSQEDLTSKEDVRRKSVSFSENVASQQRSRHQSHSPKNTASDNESVPPQKQRREQKSLLKNKTQVQQPRVSSLNSDQNSQYPEMKLVQILNQGRAGTTSKSQFNETDLNNTSFRHQMAGKLKQFLNKEMSSIVKKQNKKQFEEKNLGIQFLIDDKKVETPMSRIWSKIVLLIHTYNYFTIFYFLGIEGFPDGLWLIAEVVTEVIIVFDFFMRLVIRKMCPEIWSDMWMLHDKGQHSVFHFVLRLIGSIPQTIILIWFFWRSDQQLLKSFTIAMLRCVKLLRLRQISQYFEKIDFQNRRSKKTSFLQGLMVVYYFFLATHMIGCAWLLTARLEIVDKKMGGWFVMAMYDQYEVSNFMMYIDSLFFTVATMTGLGYGNIVPSTNLEWFVDCLIMIVGASIYANFFANFAVEIYRQNMATIDNKRKYDESRQFAIQRSITPELRKKVRYYYQNLRLKYIDFRDKYEILKDLPRSLQEEMSLIFNKELIQEVKFFQLAEPDFISRISGSLRPKICIIGEYVVRINEVATKMFFVHSGITEVLASDNRTKIAYMGKGCYFGEIGVLLTGKRSCSVKIKQTAILFRIKKNDLVDLVTRFPTQGRFLRAVGRQRLETTEPSDLMDGNAEEMKIYEQMQSNNKLQDNTALGVLSAFQTLLKTGKLEKQGESAEKGASHHNQLVRNDSQILNQYKSEKGNENTPIELMRALTASFIQEKERKPKFWQTKAINDFNHFMIVPFSPLFNIWFSILLLCLVYDTFMMPFSIALSFDFKGIFIVLDIVCMAVYVVDIYMRSRTAITTPNNACLNANQVMKHYINTWLIIDVLACLPLTYLLYPVIQDEVYLEYLQYLRLFRLLKFGRLVELLGIVNYQSDIPMALLTITKLILMFLLAAHFMACIYIFIGRRGDETGRFDGQYLFGDVNNRNFITLQKTSEMTQLELYWHFFYLSSCTMGAVMYGDMIPFTLPEQLFTFVAMLSARIYLAFVFAEAANYLSELHVGKSIHSQKVQRISRWLSLNNYPGQLINRVKVFHEILWQDFQGIDEQSILKDLPESLRHDIRTQMLQSLVQNWEAFPKNSPGTMQSVIKSLKLVIIPKNEYIIRAGQVAEDMYFIVKGVCRVLSKDNVELANLKQGQNFGEMALLDPEKPLRNASIISVTNCSLAVLTRTDFNLICEMYPEFKEKISHLAKMRKNATALKEKDSKMKDKNLGIVVEEDNKSYEQSSDVDSDSDSDESGSKRAHTLGSQRSLGQFSKDGDLEKDGGMTKVQLLTDNQQDKNQTRNLSDMQSGTGGASPEKPDTDKRGDQTTKDDVQELAEQDLPQLDKLTTDQRSSVGILHSETPQFNMGQQPRLIEQKENDSCSQSQDEESGVFEDVGSPAFGRDRSKSVMMKTNQVEEKIDEKRRTSALPSLKNFLGRNRVQPRASMVSSQSRRNSDSVTIKSSNFNSVSISIEEENQSSSPVKPQLDGKHLVRRKSTLYFDRVEHYMQNQVPIGEKDDGFCARYFNLKIIMRTIILFISLYNLIFIPLQMGFRIKFTGIYLVMEILTIFFYFLDTCLRCSQLHNLNNLKGLPPSRLSVSDRKLKNDPEQLKRSIQIQRIEIICNILGCLPIVSVFRFLEIYEPWLLIVLLSSCRLVKIGPIYRLFQRLKKQNLNFGRISEVLTYYYLICHFLAGLILAGVAFEPDSRQNWLRRIPVPVDSGIREHADIFHDVSPLSLWVHSYYFIVNTISHVAIGDITSVTMNERIFNAFLILTGTFIYSFLFGNITAIVSGLAPSQELEFYRQYNQVMSKIDNGKTPLKIIQDVNRHFDYKWSLYKGLDIDQVEKQLPDSIRSDLLLSRYQDAVQTSLIFREITGQIHIPMAISIFKKLRIEIFQSQEFILKVGQHCTDTMIVLDGQVMVYGLYNDEMIGVMSAGSHIGFDLIAEKQESQLAKYLVNQRSQLKMESNTDNFDNKSAVHLVAHSYAVVGYLSKEDTELLYKAYPDWRKMVQTMNGFLFEMAKISLEKHCVCVDKPLIRLQCLKIMQEHFTQSSEQTYESILEYDLFQSQRIMTNDLTRMFKHHYINLISNSISWEIRKTLTEQTLSASKTMKLDSGGNIISGGGCQQMYLQNNSGPRRVLELIQLINLNYIAFSAPFQVAFYLQMSEFYIMLEAISLTISVMVVLLNFRTPVIMKGRATLEFTEVAKYYYQNGMVTDICGVLPFNLLLGMTYNLTELSIVPLLIILVLRVVRVLSCWQAVMIFSQFEIYLKKFNFVMAMLKATLMLLFLGHWITCSWFFVNNIIERDMELTWAATNSLEAKTIPEQYLLCYYTVLNVVTSVGYGDMYPVTDIERVFFVLMITTGDLLFALAFGLLAQITMQRRITNENHFLVEKMLKIQQLIKVYNVQATQRERIEKYLAFIYYQKTNNTLIDYADIKNFLSKSLSREVIFHQNNELLQKMFKDFKSQNLIKELSTVLTPHVYLPNDYIIKKDDIGEEMFFIVFGEVNVIAADKQTIVTKLRKGQYFGEIAIFLSTRRTSYVQANTFAIVNSLKKSDLDQIVNNFPLVAKSIQEQADTRMQQLRTINDEHDTGSQDNKTHMMMNMIMKDVREDFSFFSQRSQSSISDTDNQMTPKRKSTVRKVTSSTSQRQRSSSEYGDSNRPNMRQLIKTQSDADLIDGEATEFKSARDGSGRVQRSRTSSSDVGANMPTPYQTTQTIGESVSVRRTKKNTRRLSKITLGKSLMLNQSAGLRLQWTVNNV